MTGKDSAVSRSVRLNKVDHIANNCYERNGVLVQMMILAGLFVYFDGSDQNQPISRFANLTLALLSLSPDICRAS